MSNPIDTRRSITCWICSSLRAFAALLRPCHSSPHSTQHVARFNFPFSVAVVHHRALHRARLIQNSLKQAPNRGVRKRAGIGAHDARRALAFRGPAGRAHRPSTCLIRPISTTQRERSFNSSTSRRSISSILRRQSSMLIGTLMPWLPPAHPGRRGTLQQSDARRHRCAAALRPSRRARSPPPAPIPPRRRRPTRRARKHAPAAKCRSRRQSEVR